VNGDVIISVEQVAINAEKYGTIYGEELFRVIIHGVLHLIGYDDVSQADRAVMKEKENEYLRPVTRILAQKKNETGI
jgi:rRNA maturation RNase YbeY